MKKLLFFSCMLSLFGAAGAMDKKDYDTRRAEHLRKLPQYVEKQSWIALAQSATDGYLIADDLTPYSKAALDTQSISGQKYYLFQELLESTHEYDKEYRTNYNQNSRDNYLKLKRFTEALIVADKISHGSTLIDKIFIAGSESNTQCNVLYNNMLETIAKHKTNIQAFITDRNLDGLGEYIFQESYLSAGYIVHLSVAEKSTILSYFKSYSTFAEKKTRLDLLRKRLSPSPSFRLSKTHYLIGGVLVALAATLVYTVYSSSSQETEDEADESHEKDTTNLDTEKVATPQ